MPTGKARAALARFVSLHPTNLAQKAEIIVEHFRQHTAGQDRRPRQGDGGDPRPGCTPSGTSRPSTPTSQTKGYDTGPHPMRALVAFSGTVVDPDAPDASSYTEALMNGFGEAQLPKRFATDEYQVLVVAEKYQTGFDQPLLHTMYVDKKLAGVKAVQTLSRLNRTHPGKTDTFVLDFVNNAEDIQRGVRAVLHRDHRRAHRPEHPVQPASPASTTPAHPSPDEVDAGVLAILHGGTPAPRKLNAAIDPAVDRWHALDTDDEREDFRTALRDFVRAYAFLAQIVPFTDTDLEKLYYYGKYLLTRSSPAPSRAAAVDLDGAVVLTHLRTELIAEQADLSLSDGHRRAADRPRRGPRQAARGAHRPCCRN